MTTQSIRTVLAVVMGSMGTLALGLVAMGVAMADLMMTATPEGAAKFWIVAPLHAIGIGLVLAGWWSVWLAWPSQTQRRVLLVRGFGMLGGGVVAFGLGMVPLLV
jgi:hypothetical protein